MVIHKDDEEKQSSTKTTSPVVARFILLGSLSRINCHGKI